MSTATIGLSPAYFERALRMIPGGVHSPVRSFRSVGGTPVFFKSAEGAILHSVDNVPYIDFCQSFGPLILGHRDPEVSQAVHDVIDTAWTFGACEPYSLELVEWIVNRVPGVEKLRLVSSGTEAVMSALRVARAATGRDKILKFEGCYHGHVDSLLVRAGSGLSGPVARSSAGVPASVAADTIVASLDREQDIDDAFSRHGRGIAAVIIEPLPANFGLLVQRKAFLSHLVDAARAHGSLVIFDEVISGFRVAKGGMAEALGLRPDLVTYGKVIGGGFPVGCYGGRAELMDLVAPAGPVYQAGTLSANPVAVCAGLATLRKVERLDAARVLTRRTSQFCEELRGRFRRAGAALDVSCEASIFWIHRGAPQPIRTVERIPFGHSEQYARLFHAALNRGVYLSPSAYEVNFLSTAHSEALLERAADVLEAAARQTIAGQ